MAATKNTDASDLATLPSSNDQAEDELTCTLHQLAVATLVEWRAKKKFDPHCLAANEELAVPILAGGLRNMVTTIISVMEAHQLPETMILAQQKAESPAAPCNTKASEKNIAAQSFHRDSVNEADSRKEEEIRIKLPIRQDSPPIQFQSSNPIARTKNVKHKGNTSAKNRRKQVQLKGKAHGE